MPKLNAPANTSSIQPINPEAFDQLAQLEAQLQPTDAWTTDALNHLHQGRSATGFGVLGLYIQKTLACYLIYQKLDVAEVLRIGTHVDFQGKGLARQLLSTWLKTLDTACLLEVRSDNVPAIGLYHSLGFQRIHVRRGYYKTAQGAIDAWIMQRTIANT